MLISAARKCLTFAAPRAGTSGTSILNPIRERERPDTLFLGAELTSFPNWWLRLLGKECIAFHRRGRPTFPVCFVRTGVYCCNEIRGALSDMAWLCRCWREQAALQFLLVTVCDCALAVSCPSPSCPTSISIPSSCCKSWKHKHEDASFLRNGEQAQR